MRAGSESNSRQIVQPLLPVVRVCFELLALFLIEQTELFFVLLDGGLF